MAVQQLDQAEARSIRSRGHLGRAWSRLIRKKIAVVSMVALAVLYTLGILAPWVAPYGYSEVDFSAIRKPPTLVTDQGITGIWTESHFAGTDRAGRDQFTRVLWGVQYTILLTALGMLTGGLVIGVSLGLMSGYFGGKTDAIIMRTGELFTVIPTFFLVVILAATLRPRIRQWVIWFEENPRTLDYFVISVALLVLVLFVAVRISRRRLLPDVADYVVIAVGLAVLGVFSVQVVSFDGLIQSWWVDFIVVSFALVIFGWFATARLIRGQILFLKETQHVEAARAIGASTSRIMSRHLLPNAISPLMVMVTMGMGSMVGVEIFLSWVGLGIQPPRPSLGLMLWESGHISVLRNQPWLLLAPGIATWLMVFCWNLLGDALNDVLNPRTR